MKLTWNPKSTIPKKDELITVLIPISGNPIHLKETLESVEQQSYQNIEVLIVLNNCEAWVKEFVEGQKERNPSLRIIETSKVGISNALNLGIFASKGELICRIDSDDLMRADRIQKQKEFLERNPNVVCVGTQVTKINVSGIRIGRSNFPGSNKQITSTLLFRNCIAHPSVMYRRSSILEVNGYRPDFDGVEDYDLWLRLSMIGQLRNMQKSLTSYRVWENQVTMKKRHLIFENAKRVRESFENSPVSHKHETRFNKKDWLKSADYFNKSLQNFRNPGEKFSALQNLLNSFRITPSLTTRVCTYYFLNFISARFRGCKYEN